MDAPGDEDWDKDTDEIKSVDSDELRANRPNRWTGAPSSWRTLTEQDRLTYTALEGVRNQDLSVHLYNAHALKRRLSFGEQDGRTPLNSRKVYICMPGPYYFWSEISLTECHRSTRSKQGTLKRANGSLQSCGRLGR